MDVDRALIVFNPDASIKGIAFYDVHGDPVAATEEELAALIPSADLIAKVISLETKNIDLEKQLAEISEKAIEDVEAEFRRRIMSNFGSKNWDEFVVMRSADVAEASSIISRIAANTATANDMARMQVLSAGKAAYDTMALRAAEIAVMRPIPLNLGGDALWEAQ